MKRRLGVTLIFLLLLVTIILWFLSKQDVQLSSISLFKLLGQLFALIGSLLFLLTFILSTKLSFLEKLFGGLDKVYQIHHVIGVWAYSLLLFHPLSLLLSTKNMDLINIYFLPSNSLSFTLGILSLYLLSLNIFVTIFIKLPYHLWKTTHKLIGFPLFLALLHSLIIVSDISRYFPLRIWILVFFLFAIVSYIYVEFLYNYLGNRFKYIVESKVDLGNVIKFVLKPLSKKLIYTPGQFVFVSFPNSKLGPEAHPYSLMSIPNDLNLEIGVKKLGDYTNEVSLVEIGNTAIVHGPYGMFWKDYDLKKQIVFIAAGIGITPFISIIRSLISIESLQNVKLHYVNKTEKDLLFKKDLAELESQGMKIKYHYSATDGYFSYQDLELNNPSKTVFYICANSNLTTLLVQDLKRNGVENNNINYEQFEIK